MQHFQGEQTSKHKGKANLTLCQIPFFQAYFYR